VRNDVAVLTGVAIGAGTMFLLDPDRGRRRRALIRDKAARAANKTTDGLDALTRDVANRTHGAAASLRSRFRDTTPDARKLKERVRAELGRVVSHPHAIEVSVLHEGCVRLSGPILSSEADAAVAAVVGVRDVATVEDDLERHDSAEGVPALQGGRIRMRRRTGLLQNSWSPTTKLMVALTGTAVAAGVTYAMRGASSTCDAAA
jgi:gas vesicle protein